MEVHVRKLTAACILIGAVGFSGPVLARDIHLEKQTPEQLKAVCEKVSGSFSQDKSGYGCGTDCKGHAGTACMVYCQPNKRCIAQVVGARRPRTIESALRGKRR